MKTLKLCLACLLCSAIAGAALAQYGYTGRETDSSGLMYYRARYYDASLGRFTQRDLIGLAGGVNDYGYVGGNPANRGDPAGTTPVGPEGLVGRVYSYFSQLGQTLFASEQIAGGFPPGYERLSDAERAAIHLNNTAFAAAGALGAGIALGPELAAAGALATAATVGEIAETRGGILPDKYRLVLAGRDAGHAVAKNVLAGGSGRAFEGHGILEIDAGMVELPLGMALTMPQIGGPTVSGALGRLMASDTIGITASSFTRYDIAGMTTFFSLPDKVARVPDFTLLPPYGLTIMQNSITVGTPTRLSELLLRYGRNAGCLSWSACTDILGQ